MFQSLDLLETKYKTNNMEHLQVLEEFFYISAGNG